MEANPRARVKEPSAVQYNVENRALIEFERGASEDGENKHTYFARNFRESRMFSGRERDSRVCWSEVASPIIEYFHASVSRLQYVTLDDLTNSIYLFLFFFDVQYRPRPS